MGYRNRLAPITAMQAARMTYRDAGEDFCVEAGCGVPAAAKGPGTPGLAVMEWTFSPNRRVSPVIPYL